MHLLSHLLTIVAILLPLGRGETNGPIALKLFPVQRAEGEPCATDLIYCPDHPPAESESYFECLDETALDEEDSTRVEDHGIIPLTFLDFETPLANHLLSSSLPASPHSQLLIIAPILRC